MKIAYIFSGQGAQATGMGRELCDSFAASREIFRQADEALGFSLSGMCFEEDKSADLNKTEFTQPAILAMSAAALAALKTETEIPAAQYVAGLSLGEYSALYAAGVFEFGDAVSLVRRRGKLMAEGVPDGFGAMSAILSLDNQLVEKACAEASNESGRAYATNYNAPGQLVISGEAEAVARAEKLCLEYGAKKAVRLAVSGCFHTPYLNSAAENFAVSLEGIKLGEMKIPVLTNVTGDLIPSIDDIKPILLKQMVSPVRWEGCVRRMLELGVDTFIELGPGRSLCSFVKKITKEAAVYNIEDMKSFEKTVAGLKGAQNG